MANKFQENYFKLMKLIFDCATPLIRARFISGWKAKFDEKWQDKKLTDNFVQFNKTIRNTNKSQKELLKNVDSNKWDVSLWALIFNTPSFDKSQYLTAINIIKDCRNMVKLLSWLNYYY